MTERCSFWLPKEVKAQLKVIASNEGTTIISLVLQALKESYNISYQAEDLRRKNRGIQYE